jgi:hypothetical protein
MITQLHELKIFESIADISTFLLVIPERNSQIFVDIEEIQARVD